MSQKEFQRVKVIENAAGGRLSVREAARAAAAERTPGATLPRSPPGAHNYSTQKKISDAPSFNGRSLNAWG